MFRHSHRNRQLISGIGAIATVGGLILSGCADAPDPADVVPPVASCTGLRPLLDAHQLQAGSSYSGANGFEFEPSIDTTPSAADIGDCVRLEGLLARLIADGVPGASIAYRSPRFELRAAQGLADVDAGVPLNTDALLRVASVAKTYLGSLAALLVSEGRLDLDNSDGAHALADYLPETIGRVQYAERITVRQLLDHTSGVPDYFGETIAPRWYAHVLDSYHRGASVSEDDALALVYGSPADFEPGTSAKYSNSAYLLAARVIERVLGRPYSDEIRARFLSPLGLDDTYFEKHDAFEVTRLAHGYRDASELGENFSDWYGVDQGYGFANGGVVARLDEIATFFRAVPGGQALPVDIDRMGFLSALRPTDTQGYGLGLERNGDCYLHHGTFNGYETVAWHCTDSDVSGALFINSSLPEHDTALLELEPELMR
jgi:D-alanyl-D-alanine carboxypeptidase